MLSVLVFLPLAGAGALALPWFREDPQGKADDSVASPPGGATHHDLPGLWGDVRRARVWAFGITLLTFLGSLVAAWHFDASRGASFQFPERISWIPGWGISYAVGIDGISLLLVLLTTLLMPIVILSSASIRTWSRGYLACMLVLETAMLGTLVAMDLFLFYVFWELMLAPMYFIIGIWGGKRRIYATLKFVLYTVAGSVLMLAGILFVVWQYFILQGEFSFYLPDLVNASRLTFRQECWLFAAFALAFSIKVPVFPFHTWLPDAHVEAPTGGSVILAGVLLKMGLYGFVRYAYPLFPRAALAFAPYLAVLAVIGIVYGALLAWAQSDMKKLVAYSSVSHLGFCVLGLSAFNVVALSGGLYQMLNHGISTGALFLIVGVLYERRHTREISEYGGLAQQAPLFAFFFMIFSLSSIALPLTNGFVGEFMILVGSFRVLPGLTAIALFAVVLGAVYMLTLYLKTMFGELDSQKNGQLPDMTIREVCMLTPLLVLVFVMGVLPQPFLRTLEPAVSQLIVQVQSRAEILQQQEIAPDRQSFGSSDRRAMLGQPWSEGLPYLPAAFKE